MSTTTMTPNGTQFDAATFLHHALNDARLFARATVGYTGKGCNDEPCDGASADFNTEDGARRVHCYRDDDGAWMIDAMDANVGVPAPAPYSRGLLIAYLVWATGENDDAFAALAQASRE